MGQAAPAVPADRRSGAAMTRAAALMTSGQQVARPPPRAPAPRSTISTTRSRSRPAPQQQRAALADRPDDRAHPLRARAGRRRHASLADRLWRSELAGGLRLLRAQRLS